MGDFVFDQSPPVQVGHNMTIDLASIRVTPRKGESVEIKNTSAKSNQEGNRKRATKTKAERAQEALVVAERRQKRLHERRGALLRDLREIESELTEAERDLEYARANPYLAKDVSVSLPGGVVSVTTAKS